MGGRKLKVMHVVESLDIDGVGNGVVNLCNRLARERYEAGVCSVYRRGRLESVLHDDVERICLHRPRGCDWSGPWWAAAVFRERQVDIVHTHGWAGGAWTGILGARIARVPMIINDERGRLRGSGYRRRIAQRFLSRYISETVAASDGQKEGINRIMGVPAGQITCIPNGVDTVRFRPSVLQGHRARLEWGIGERELVIGTVGRLTEQEEHARLIEAARELSREAAFRLVIVGDGPLRAALERRAAAAGIGHLVCFTGMQNDVAALINMMDIFALPAAGEGMPGALLEAMACGRPVVAAASSGVREIVADGENGIMVTPGDTRALFLGLRSLMRSPWKNGMGYAARRHVEREFNIDTMVRRYEALYEYCGAGDRRRNYAPFPESARVGAGVSD